MTTQKVISATQQDNGKNYGGEKELTGFMVLMAVKDGQIIELASLKDWMGRSSSASRRYASIWIHAPGFYASGTGWAGGGGYCKRSAAAGSAIKSAGIVLESSINGVGESAMRDALLAIGAHLGYENCAVIEG